MEKPVIISIKGKQKNADQEGEAIELVTQGTLTHDEENGYAVSYMETDMTGLKGTTTTFRVGKDRVVLSRSGTLNAEMVFQEGQRHVTMYETPFGGLVLGIWTHRVKADLHPSGGHLSIHYDLAVEEESAHHPLGEDAFEIDIWEQPPASAGLS